MGPPNPMGFFPPQDEVMSFLRDTQGIEDPQARQAERQRYFDKKFLDRFNLLEPGDRRAVLGAFGIPPPSADKMYAMDIRSRGGDPTQPAQAGGGVRALGATGQDVVRNPLDLIFGGQVPSGKPDDVFGSIAEGMLDPVGWGAGFVRGLNPALMGVLRGTSNQLLRGSIEEGLKKAATWGTMGMGSIPISMGKGLWRLGKALPETRIPWRTPPPEIPPAIPPPTPVMAPPASAPSAAGMTPDPTRMRVTFGPGGIQVQ
jgi:hypothetical protein